MTVNGPLTMRLLGGASHDITVVAASDDGSSSSQSFTISVTDDLDEHDVTEILDIDGSPNQVPENALGAEGITVSATDADNALDTVTYTLSDDADGLFDIDGSGQVTVNGSLDYETGTSHDITVLASSADGSSSIKETFQYPSH